jgi:transcription elongation GreA/GreB family factor
VGEQAVIALSPKAPLAQLLMNKKNGETFSFNQRQHQLLEIL